MVNKIPSVITLCQKNMEGKVCDVTDGKMEKSDPKVFWRSPSQCIYSMVLGFFHPRQWPVVFYCPWYLPMVFLPILVFTVFYPFWERVGINHNKCSSSLHLWEGIMMFWTIFCGNTIVKVKSKGNMVGILCMHMV